MTLLKKLLVLIAAIAAFSGFLIPVASAQAQPKAPLTVQPGTKTADAVAVVLVRRRVSMVNGKEVVEAANLIKPGEIIEETATYTNQSAAAVRNLEATLPIPPYTELVAGSVQPAAAKASLDGRVFDSMPLKRKSTAQQGVVTEQLVPLDEYRALRWYPGVLNVGQSLDFKARFRVSDTGGVAPPPTPPAASAPNKTPAKKTAGK